MLGVAYFEQGLAGATKIVQACEARAARRNTLTMQSCTPTIE